MKPVIGKGCVLPGESHPAGVRGLKPIMVLISAATKKSHPAGVRGLKPRSDFLSEVANPGRTPQGCVG